MTASFRTLAWPPFWVCWARFQVLEAPVSTVPRIKPRDAQRTNQLLGHLRTARADLELHLRRLAGDGLFHNHRTSAIHLRNRFPSRHGIKRLAAPECFNQCLSFAGYFLPEFRPCRRRSGLHQKIAKARVIAIASPPWCICGFASRGYRLLCCFRSPFAFHVSSSLSARFISGPGWPAAAPNRASRLQFRAPNTPRSTNRWGFLRTSFRPGVARETR